MSQWLCHTRSKPLGLISLIIDAISWCTSFILALEATTLVFTVYWLNTDYFHKNTSFTSAHELAIMSLSTAISTHSLKTLAFFRIRCIPCTLHEVLFPFHHTLYCFICTWLFLLLYLYFYFFFCFVLSVAYCFIVFCICWGKHPSTGNAFGASLSFFNELDNYTTKY